MKNVFENAYFGKQYKTRNGHKALFIHHYKDSESDDMYQLIVDGSVVTYVYTKNGEIAPNYNNKGLDIVSEWKEEINEEKLDELADAETFKKSEEFDNCLDDILSLLDGENKLKIIFKKGLIWAFKVGYRKKNGENEKRNYRFNY